MKSIVVYYSNHGSNETLARKTADALKCEILPLNPRVTGLVLPATASRISFGNRPLKVDFEGFDSVVLCGPIYMGSIAAPCNDFIRKYGKKINKLSIISCCGSTDEKKNETFGYARTFRKLKKRLGTKAGVFEAFPVELILSEDEKQDDQAFMNARLTDANFKGKIKDRFDDFVVNFREG